MLPVLEVDETLDALFCDGLGLRGGPDIILHGQGDLSWVVAVLVELGGVQTDLEAAEALQMVEDHAVGAVREDEVYFEGIALGVGTREKLHLPENIRVERLELRKRAGSTQLSS